jgi:hypothetical protein
MTSKRETLAGTNKTMGDFNLQNRFSFEAEPRRGHRFVLGGVRHIYGTLSQDTQTITLGNVRHAIRSPGPGENRRHNPPTTLQIAFTTEAHHFYHCLGKNNVLYAFYVVFHDDAGCEVGRITLADATITSFERKYTPDAAQFGTNWMLEIQFIYQKATIVG